MSVRVLGKLALVVDGQQIPFQEAHSIHRELFVRLALEGGRPIATDTLMRDLGASREDVRQRVRRLRYYLADDRKRIVTSVFGKGYCLAAGPGEIDYSQFLAFSSVGERHWQAVKDAIKDADSALERHRKASDGVAAFRNAEQLWPALPDNELLNGIKLSFAERARKALVDRYARVVLGRVCCQEWSRGSSDDYELHRLQTAAREYNHQQLWIATARAALNAGRPALAVWVCNLADEHARDMKGKTVQSVTEWRDTYAAVARVKDRRVSQEIRSEKQADETDRPDAPDVQDHSAEEIDAHDLRYAWLHGLDVSVIACADKDVPADRDHRFNFEPIRPTPRDDPDVWLALEARLLPLLLQDARRRDKILQNGPRVDLVREEKRRDEHRRPGYPTQHRLTVAPTDYYRFAAMSNSLDLDLTIKLGGNTEGVLPPEVKTLRELWQRDPANARPINWHDVGALPAPATIGVVTVVVLPPSMMVLLTRTTEQMQVGATTEQPHLLHFVGEGTLPRDTVTDEQGREVLSPEATARRSLQDELGIDVSRHLVDLRMAGAFFDRKRWQPMFCYVARVDLAYALLRGKAASSKDSWEVGQTSLYPWSIYSPATRSLLTDTHQRRTMASNHARAALFFALCLADGRDAVISEMDVSAPS